MGVKLVSSGGGSVEINPPATASSFTATMPAGTGTVAVNGVSGTLVSGTAVASTSGTSIDFTGIPSWVKRVTVMFQGVSTNGTSSPLIQLGAGSITNTGYLCSSSTLLTTVTSQQSTAGFIVTGAGVVAASTLSGLITIDLIASTTWVCGISVAFTNSAGSIVGGGNITLGGTLDRIRITTVNGTDTFDAGSINILYE